MTDNAEGIVAQVTDEFQGLVAYVTGPTAAEAAAYTVELTLLRRLLGLGALLWRVFFLTRARARPAAPAAGGLVPLPYYDRRPTTYYSVFGKLHFARHYFAAPGHAGVCPLDADLSLPPRCYSDLLREWLGYASTAGSFRESQLVVERLLGQAISVQAIETMATADARDVAAFYAQPPLPLVAPAATLLVVQADGKGVPQRPPPEAVSAPARLGKGQKRTTKKEAVVTSLYRIAPYPRTPADVVAALLHEQDDRAQLALRPAPVRKEVRATLTGKAPALLRLAARATQYDETGIQHHVALTDGAEALQQQVLAHFPAYTLVLDIIHAAEYLWEAANALLGERHPQRTPWVRAHLTNLLVGQAATVIAALDDAASAPTCTDSQREVLRRVSGYYQRNAPSMRYHESLAHGWPIGTGVVEGACGHLVKDRLDQSGMRWTLAGAEAILDLRAVRLNGDWDAYWAFHRQQQHQRLYGLTAVPPRPEDQLDRVAA